MSTRANIVLKEGKNEMFFYRHADGYPEGTMPILEKFLDGIKTEKYRDNLSQCGGWLIVLGREEMLREFKNKVPEYYAWKVGFIEPTDSIHGDVEYVYTIDLETKEIHVK